MVTRDLNAAFLPNAIALVRAHLAAAIDPKARLVANRPACFAVRRGGELTPAEIWDVCVRFVDCANVEQQGRGAGHVARAPQGESLRRADAHAGRSGELLGVGHAVRGRMKR